MPYLVCMMIRKICLLAVSLVLGCSGAAESEPLEPVECPKVECAFDQGGCDPETHTYKEATVSDDGAGCWAIAAACFPKSTPAGCEPEPCYFATSLACGQ